MCNMRLAFSFLSCVACSMHSDNLRAALGIKLNQLPPYIYQMRVFGYPPGHLESARQETSGLAMFGKHGLGVPLKQNVDVNFGILIETEISHCIFPIE